MSKSILQAISQAYGLEAGVQTRMGPALQSKMGMTFDEREFLRSLPDCWLVVRMDNFDSEVQLSFFVLCRQSSAVGASRRIKRKTRGLKFMQEAEFEVYGGTPLAHCTVLLRKRRRNVVLSFLEKDLTRRTKGLNFGQFLVAVALHASAPFCPQDAEMLVEAADNGTGKLLAFYERLGFSAIRTEDGDGLTRMRSTLANVLASCSSFNHAGATEAASCKKLRLTRPTPAGAAASELCAICIDFIGSDGQVAPNIHTLDCGHCFHAGCIQRWLANSRHCPLCKREAAVQMGGG